MNLWPALIKSKLTSTQKLVILFYADKADVDGTVWWTQKRVAETMNVDRKSVCTALAIAEGAKLLRREERSRQGRQVIYTYRFRPDLLPKGREGNDPTAISESHTDDGQIAHRRGENDPSDDRRTATQNLSYEPLNEFLTEPLNEAFSQRIS